MDNIRDIFYPHFPHLLSDLGENMYNSMNICRLADKWSGFSLVTINPLNPELNPICYLLALLGAHSFLHVSMIRVKSLTFRRLMSYIYIYICVCVCVCI